MSEIIQFGLNFDHNEDQFLYELKKNKINFADYHILRKSIDARNKRDIKFIYRVKRGKREKTAVSLRKISYKGPKPVIVGTGPAGIFAAYALIKQGITPLIIEKGKRIQERNLDMARFLKQGVLKEDSNICFGEGGAGAFSDGKLYTRIKGEYVKLVLEVIAEFSGDETVITDTYPHVGTQGIKKTTREMLEWLVKNGAELLFDTKLLRINLSRENKLISIGTNNGEIQCESLILATGHSADEVFYEYARAGGEVKFKPFAVGYRIEHKADLIDKIQFGPNAGHERLGHAEYRLVHSWKEEQRTVYSFCMCPGGFVLNTASDINGVVSNGMSMKGRSGRFSNSAIVINIRENDISGNSPFKGLEFQRQYEQRAAELANSKGGVHALPAQNLGYFMSKGKKGLRDSSALSPLSEVDLALIYPEKINDYLKKGIRVFNRKMPGFADENSLLIGVETRTSSPLQIVRNRETMESKNIQGIYPCGEGSGYAGGITSSAVDGILCAIFLAEKLSR